MATRLRKSTSASQADDQPGNPPVKASPALYTADFYRNEAAGAQQAAEIVVPMIIELLKPGSVIDVGCGSGNWLAAFMSRGITDILGVEGDWLGSDILKIPQDRLLRHDLRQPLALDRSFDLVLCLEVGEHLPAESAETLVQSLTRLGPAVLFSAAIPHQMGVGHINEQWPEYWQARFAQYGFQVVDCLRSRLWNDARVEGYYAQNILIYADKTGLRRLGSLGSPNGSRPALPISLVHPRVYSRSLEAASPTNIGLRSLLRALPTAVGKALGRRLMPSVRALRRHP